MKPAPRVFTERLPETGGELSLDGEAGRHVTRALRMREGDELVLVDGRGGWSPALLLMTGRRALIKAGARREAERRGHLVECWLPLIRPSRLETAVEKLTELGAGRIRPYYSARCGNRRRSLDLSRLRRIMRAALEQSGNLWLPELRCETGLDELLRDAPEFLLLADGSAPAGNLPAGGPSESGRLALLAGPEGGFSEEESAVLEGVVSHRIRLGAWTLRSETALIALHAALNAALFDPGSGCGTPERKTA